MVNCCYFVIMILSFVSKVYFHLSIVGITLFPGIMLLWNVTQLPQQITSTRIVMELSLKDHLINLI